MAFNNFTVSIVAFSETAGLDWTISNPSVVLLLTPNLGYNITASNFSATAPLPSNVSSVVFSQNGNNVNCTVTYISPSVMPASDVLIAVCASGFAEENLISISGVLKDCGLSNISQPTNLPLAYTSSGIFGSVATVLSQTVTASANYYFDVEPVLALALGNLSNYTITSAKTFNAANQLTQIIFTVTYTFPQTSVSGDEFCLTANAQEIYSPNVNIVAYTYATPAEGVCIPQGGLTSSYILSGIQGALWDLMVISSTGTIIFDSNGAIDSTGTKTLSIVIPAATTNTDYTFTLTGDLASSFNTPAGQPSVFTVCQSAFIQLNYGANPPLACCEPVLGNYILQGGLTFNTATAILNLNGTQAANGFYTPI